MNEEDFGEEYYAELNCANLGTDSFWMVNKVLASIFTPNVALFLSILIDKYKFHKKRNSLTTDGFFYETIEAMNDKISLPQHSQETCIKILKGYGCLETALKGLPAKRHFLLKHKPIHDLHIKGKSSETYLSYAKQVNTELLNCEITDSYKKDDDGTVYRNPLNLLRRNVLQVKTNNKNKSILNAKAFSGENPPQHKTILPRKANNPLILVDTSVPPLVRPEGVKPRFSKLHKIKRPTVTFDIQQIIDYWIAKGLHIHEEGTKSFDQAVIYITKAFNATLLEDFVDPKFRNYRFSVDSIKRSIDNFYLAAFDNKYEPLSINTKQLLQRMSFKDFFWDKHRPNDENKSHVFKYLSKRKLASESSLLVMKDTHPRCTKLVKDWYHQEFGGMVTEVSRQQQNAMILVGRKIEEFLVTHKAKLDMDYGMQINCNRDPLTFLVGELLRCESKILRENDGLRSIFQPSWLISENMLTDRFVYFLKSERTMK